MAVVVLMGNLCRSPTQDSGLLMKDQDRWFNMNNVYAYRDDNLRRLGFTNYRAYLRSDLWKSIRLRVLLDENGEVKRCFRCWRRATQVHHRAYDPATLAGTQIGSLVQVCAKHHRHGEMPHRRQKAHDRLMGANKRIWKDGRECDRNQQVGWKGRARLRKAERQAQAETLRETQRWRKLIEVEWERSL